MRRLTRFYGLACLAWALLLPAAGLRAETVKLTFLHVNDVYEYQKSGEAGGLAVLKAMITAEKKRHPGAVATFGGDLLSPSIASSVTEGSHMIDFMNHMGLVAATLGNHEFDFGVPVLRSRLQDSRFPWVTSNIYEKDGKVFANLPQTLMVTIKGLKVGFFGVLTVESGSLSVGGRDVAFQNETESAKKAVASLRDQGADVVVALTHLDFDQDRRLVNDVPGIDLVLGGHDHNVIAYQENGVMIVKAGENAQFLAVAELSVDKSEGQDGKTAVKIRSSDIRFDDAAGVAPDHQLMALTRHYDAKLGQQFNQPLAKLETTMDSHVEVVRSREAAIGNLFADALKDALQADAALINGGSLRGNRTYDPGYQLTRSDVLKESPFRNAVSLIEVDGADLLSALENGVAKAPNLGGRFPQVSGLSFAYDTAREVGKRVLWAKVGEKPVTAGQRYRLATNSYLADGGDGYASLKNGHVLVDAASAPLLTTVVVEYLQKLKTVSPKVEGRVGEQK